MKWEELKEVSGDEMSETNKTCQMQEAMMAYLYKEASEDEARRFEAHLELDLLNDVVTDRVGHGDEQTVHRRGVLRLRPGSAVGRKDQTQPPQHEGQQRAGPGQWAG